MPGFSESDPMGGGFGLPYNGRTVTDTRAEVGSRLDRALGVYGNAILLLLRARRLCARLGERSDARYGLHGSARDELRSRRPEADPERDADHDGRGDAVCEVRRINMLQLDASDDNRGKT